MTYLKILVITLALYIGSNFFINLSNLEVSVNFLGLPLKYTWNIDVCSAYLNVTIMKYSREYHWSFGPEGSFPVGLDFCFCRGH